MNFATSTEAGTADKKHRQSDQHPADPGVQPWHVYAVLSLAAATVAVWFSRNTQPLALALLSAAVLAAGLVGLTLHRALAGFFRSGGEIEPPPLGERAREVLEREKALVLRSIKELEFDHAMGKVGEADFTDMSSRLRARALGLMQDLERTKSGGPASTGQPSRAARRRCDKCGTSNDPDAKFCKNCGQQVEA
jgi:hypothetical protein